MFAPWVNLTPMSAWQAHLTKFRASHPKLSMKECMQQASKSYTPSCAAYRGAAAKKKKAAPKKGAKRPMTAWMKHVMAHKAKHGGSLGDAMKAAKATYKKK